MALEIGSRLGHYEVTALIGEGGMGQVYQATDTKLKRQVALKILPEAFSADPERLARFQREAEVLASLNHPNIAAIHGLEEADSTRALVLELVEGPTLADRIKRGPIPLDEALPIAKQIAEALEAAHETGVIHRDLKPANVKVKDDGTVKVLDFGLAKALDPSPTGDPSQSPTLTAAATQMGVIMGTAAYMSPEQAKGKVVDTRADVWAFGCVLYEMLTGTTLFVGEDVSETLAAVLRADPDLQQLSGDTPQPIRHLLGRCLVKDRADRLGHISEARFHIHEALTTPSAETMATEAVTSPVAGWRRALPWSVAILMSAVGLLGAWTAWRSPGVESLGVQRFTISVPATDAANLNDFSIGLSPDGNHLAFIGRRANREEIHLRPLDQLAPIPLPGTQNPFGLLFSPDGEWIAFTTREGRQLKRVALAGGAPEVICDLQAGARFPNWSDAGDIFFGTPEGLYRVPAAGGIPEQMTEVDVEAGSHDLPHALPGGKGVLFAVGDGPSPFTNEGYEIAVLSLETQDWKVLPLSGGAPRYSPTGHILFLRDQAGAAPAQELWAVAFDVDTLEVTGEPAVVLEGIDSRKIGISRNGVLAYVPVTGRVGARLLWVDRGGRARPLTAERRSYTHLDLSPDGTRVVVESERALWIHDINSGRRIRLSRGGFPVWSPDGQWVNFVSRVGQQGRLNRVRADGSSEPEPFAEDPGPTLTGSFDQTWGVPFSIPPDGEALAVAQRNGDIWVVPRADDPRPLLDGPFEERTPTVSNNGRWLAYVSNETGQDEVYVTPYPGPGPKESVSLGGGLSPAWSADGRELFYRDSNRVMVVDIETDPSFVAGTPRELFTGNYRGDLHGHSGWDVAPDGQHFVMIESPESVEINIVLNWHEELKRLVPVD